MAISMKTPVHLKYQVNLNYAIMQLWQCMNLKDLNCCGFFLTDYLTYTF